MFDMIYKVLYNVLYNTNKQRMVLSMEKTPDYIKKAVNNYRDKFDIIQVRFPKGTKEKLKELGNVNEYIVKCVMQSLDGTQNDNSTTKQKVQKIYMQYLKSQIMQITNRLIYLSCRSFWIREKQMLSGRRGSTTENL